MASASPTPAHRFRALAGFVLLGFVVAVGVSYTTRTEPARSTLDGATLAGAPAPTTRTVLDGGWMADVETWMDERILGRYTWLSLHATISRDVLKVEVLNDIATDPETRMEYEKPPVLKERPDLGDLAATLGDQVRAAGSKPLFVYVPRKEESFSDRVPPVWPNTYLAARPRVLAALSRGGEVLDLSPTMADPATRDSSYYLTDHHWTPQGALRGLDAIAAKAATMGVRLGDQPPMTDVSYPDFIGSYGRRVTAAGVAAADPFVVPTPSRWNGRICKADGSSCKDPFIPRIARAKDPYTNRYAAFLGGDIGFQDLRNPSPQARGTVLVLKDSYGLPLVTYLAQRATRVVSVDERKYSGTSIAALVAEVKPDLVIVAHNERTLLGDPSFDPGNWVRPNPGPVAPAG